MLIALRTWWHRQALAFREAYRDIYRHYRLEYHAALNRPAVHRSHGDRAILEALAQAHEDQHQRQIEQQVRRYAEAARFVSKEPKA